MNQMKAILYKPHFQPITPARVAFLGLYLAIMITLKYVLGFIPGIEVITFMFIVAGIFLPLVDGMLLVASFNIMMIAMYGWGTWQIMYWVMWPFDVLSSKLLSKFTRSKYTMAFWGFICGFLVAFWYFVSDFLFYGFAYAFLNIISALPINLIEGFTTTIVILTCADNIASIFKLNANRLWGQKHSFIFNKNNLKYAGVLVLILNVLFATAIVLLFAYNHVFLDLKELLMGHERATKI